MPIPAKPKICLDGISLISTCPIKNVHHHRVDAAVHLTLSISMACIYMCIYARHKAKAANPSHQACCLILALTPGKHPLKQCWGTFIWKSKMMPYSGLLGCGKFRSSVKAQLKKEDQHHSHPPTQMHT